MDKEKLLSLYFYSTLDENEKKLLAEWLKKDPAFVEQFVRESYVQRTLYDIFRGQDTKKLFCDFASASGYYEVDLWEALLREEKTAPTIELEVSAIETPEPILGKIEMPKVSRKINKFALWTALTSLAAMIFMVSYVYLNPKETSEPVATLADVINAQWGEFNLSLKPGTRLFTKQGMVQLKEGVIKVQFDNGADMVVEAPSEFELITYDQVELHRGQVYFTVPNQAIGFTVNTPSSKIIDLGTGFGVRVKSSGVTDVQVLKGKISLISGTSPRGRKSQVVFQGQARRVEKESDTIQEIVFDKNAFVQEINSRRNYIWRGGPVDLADVLGGGNGFGTGRLNVCIDFQNGKLTSKVPRFIQSVTPYIKVQGMEFIDGIFIPDGKTGPIQVSSKGHQYPDCPATSGGSYNGPFNGSMLPFKIKNEYRNLPVNLGGQQYGTAEHPAIVLHANMGITFDLESIRKSLPYGVRIAGFSSFYGVAEGLDEDKAEHNYSDFYVLVDGQERLKTLDMEYRTGLKAADLILTDNDRFLTLMTTEGKDKAVRLDLCLFAGPKLNLESVETKN
jgi:hypothetical protein